MANIFDKFPRIKYSVDLHQHLKGLDIKCETYSSQDFYALLYPVLIITCIVVMLNYYYGLFNRPKCANILWWLLNIFVVTTGFFCWAFFKSTEDLNNHNYCESLHFNSSDCLMFGLTAACYALITCFVSSLAIKWGSTHNKLIPFKLI